MKAADRRPAEYTVGELIVDFITFLDGYASGKGWPGGGVSKVPGTSAGSTSDPTPRCSWVRTPSA